MISQNDGLTARDAGVGSVMMMPSRLLSNTRAEDAAPRPGAQGLGVGVDPLGVGAQLPADQREKK